MLQAAFSAGLASAGRDVEDLGVIPTPGVAFSSARRGLPAAMISASHNPFGDNGIKLFLPGGHKLSDDVQRRLESAMAEPPRARASNGVGTLRPMTGPGAYLDHVSGAATAKLDGLRIVLDCANGAASGYAPELFRSLGAEVRVINDEPDGRNINDGCGSTHPQRLAAVVLEAGAHLGLAFDGDADRVLAVDHTGALVDGDQIIAVLALDAQASGWLTDDTVVVTVMSNVGLRLAMERSGIRVVETAVGDRYVADALAAGGWALGGEQSGHVIVPNLATTGDGMLTGVLLSSLVVRSRRSLAELAAVMDRLPQVLRNVAVADRDAVSTSPQVLDAVVDAERELGGSGRVLLRPSGTEQLVRVMVEAATSELADAVCDRLCEVVVAVSGGR